MNARDAIQLIDRPKEIYDGAIPSGNSTAAMVLQKLSSLTGDRKWQEAARRQLEYCAYEVKEYPAGHSFALLAVAKALYPHKELVCVVSGDISEGLKKHLRNMPRHGLDILVKTRENAKALAECAPFTANYPLPQAGEMYYLCEDGACRAPVMELEELFKS